MKGATEDLIFHTGWTQPFLSLLVFWGESAHDSNVSYLTHTYNITGAPLNNSRKRILKESTGIKVHIWCLAANCRLTDNKHKLQAVVSYQLWIPPSLINRALTNQSSNQSVVSVVSVLLESSFSHMEAAAGGSSCFQQPAYLPFLLPFFQG